MSDYPQLAAAQARWLAFRAEVLGALAARPDLAGGDGAWTLPLLPEPADPALAPATTSALRGIPGVRAATLSVLGPGQRSVAPRGERAERAALLCLQSAGHIVVDGERHDLVDGEILLFDHGRPHEARNDGARDQIVLLLLLDPAAARSNAATLKWIAARVVEEIFGARHLAVADEIFTPALAVEVKALAGRLHEQFPDLAVEIQHLVAEGGKVACGWRARGTSTAGARKSWAGLAIYVVRDGRIVEMTMSWDDQSRSRSTPHASIHR